MKTRVRNEQKRCGLQVGRNRLFLIFCFFGIKTKEKNTVFEPFNLRIYLENLTKELGQDNISILTCSIAIFPRCKIVK